MYKIVKSFDKEILEIIALTEPLAVLEYTIKNMLDSFKTRIASGKKTTGGE